MSSGYKRGCNVAEGAWPDDIDVTEAWLTAQLRMVTPLGGAARARAVYRMVHAQPRMLRGGQRDEGAMERPTRRPRLSGVRAGSRDADA